MIATRENWLDPDYETHSEYEDFLPICESCHQVIYDEYCDVDGKMLCPDCADDYVHENYVRANMHDAYQYAENAADALQC